MSSPTSGLPATLGHALADWLSKSHDCEARETNDGECWINLKHNSRIDCQPDVYSAACLYQITKYVLVEPIIRIVPIKDKIRLEIATHNANLTKVTHYHWWDLSDPVQLESVLAKMTSAVELRARPALPAGKILVVLQNAWSSLARDSWPYESWVKALRASRSGRRLRVLLGDDWAGLRFGNTTPKIATESGQKLVPDLKHLRRLLKCEAPDVVLACGDQAAEVLKTTWRGNLICVPHPASRVLTDYLYTLARWCVLHAGLPAPKPTRLQLKQGKGSVQIAVIGGTTADVDRC